MPGHGRCPTLPAVMMEGPGERPLFSFGVISDVQYADCDDGHSYHGVQRYYRNARLALRQAVQAWNEMNREASEKGSPPVSFVINLGDIIDGRAKENALAQLNCVLDDFRGFRGGPVYHLVGNHCLYNLSRDQLHSQLSHGEKATIEAEERDAYYYDFTPHPWIRVACVDAYDLSLMGRPVDHPRRVAAERILRQHNPNADLNSPLGMAGLLRRFVAFNGALGEEQMEWLEGVLEDAKSKEQHVIICSHTPLCPPNSRAYAFLWNYEEVMELLQQYPCVKLVLAGHDHEGGYRVFHAHHYTFPGVVECKPGTNAFCRMDVFPNRVEMKGFGGLADMSFNF